jgi:hypothetical protein
MHIFLLIFRIFVALYGIFLFAFEVKCPKFGARELFFCIVGVVLFFEAVFVPLSYSP